MSLLAEQYIGGILDAGGYNSALPTVLTSTLSVSGAVSFTSTIATGALTVTGAATISSTLGVTGAITATGGVTPVGAPQSVFTTGGSVVTAASGTDNACAANTVTWSPIWFPCNMTITGLGYLIGSVGGTNKTVLSIYTSAGVFLKSTTLAAGGTTVGTAANWQAIDLTATQAVTGGTIYYVATNFDGNTAKYRGYPGPGLKFVTGTASQTLGTPATITPGTSFVNDVGPIMFAY